MEEPVSLTPEQLKEHVAKELLTLLRVIAQEGHLDDNEILLLNEWLTRAEAPNGVPAIKYLRKLIRHVLSESYVSEPARKQLICAIVRILPEEYQENARLHFGEHTRLEHEAEGPMGSLRKRGPLPATQSQIDLMVNLGIEFPLDCSFHEADALIWKVITRQQGQPKH